MVPLVTESYSRKMTGDAADDPVWDAFVDAMLALGATGEGGSRYGDKPALVLDAREIAHREGPGLIDLRLTRTPGRATGDGKTLTAGAAPRRPPR